MSKTMDRILLIVSIVSLSISAVFTLISLFSKQKSKVVHYIAMAGTLVSNLCLIVSVLAEPKKAVQEAEDSDFV